MKKISAVFILLLFLALYSAFNYAWVKQDTIPFWFDYALYFRHSIQIFKAARADFSSLVNSILGIKEFADVYHPHRILLPLVSAPFYSIWGVSKEVAVMTTTIFFAILIFSIFGITEKMLNRTAGVAAVLMFSFYPYTYSHLRVYSPEFAVMAMVTLSIYLLILSEHYQKGIFSLIFGISLGLGMITKEIYAVFIIGPLIYSIYDSLTGNYQICARRQRFLNILFSLSVGALITSIWYLPHISQIYNRITLVAYSEEIRKIYGYPAVLSWEGLTFYLFAAQEVMWFYLIFFFLSLTLSYNKLRHNYIFKILMSWIIVSYFILTSAKDKSPMYFFPLMPAFAAITSVGLMSLESRLLKISILVPLILIGALLFVSTVFPAFNIFPGYKQRYGWTFPRNEDWKTSQILNYIKEINDKLDKPYEHPIIYVIPNTSEVSAPVFAYYNEMLNLGFRFRGRDIHRNYHNLRDNEIDSDFLILKDSGYQGDFVDDEYLKWVSGHLKANADFIELPSKFLLPDNSAIRVYLKKNRNQ